MSIKPAIIVHGGAGTFGSHGSSGFKVNDVLLSGVQDAAKAGYIYLINDEETASVVDAVEAAVCSLENNPLFNAGTGSALTEDGNVEMDAIIMEGRDLRSGGVTCVTNIKNPISLARLVMDKTEHILLGGKGANAFARTMGVPEVPTEELITENRLRALKTRAGYTPTVKFMYKADTSGMDNHDTVGAVAVDAHGNVACATSTGGISSQMAGRIGDSPLIGCGAYCDNAVGSVSTTGHGEAIAKMTLARHATFLMEQGMSPQAALEKALTSMAE
ncbi:isoaspartyl peptidase/L-asparaginase-like [Asterias rubens]|uniref:isoaspartyl peptidase/L-asparaginase-like n=1 Tax=Asterias rubens TaxID=7604 RepID=UPI0014557E96|nr:isoaspartyl peptidase/L-asparaginase-like [Asterias rubens]